MDKNYLEKLFGLTGKVAIITGAAGQLGGEYVRALLKAGASVGAFDTWLENPKGNLKLIKSKKLVLVKVDITKKESIKQALKKVLLHLGEPDILINNAALDTPPDASELDTGPFETYPEKSWQQMMDVNLKGMFFCCQVIGGQMAKTGGGSIINISSIYGMVSPNQKIYEYKRKKGQIFYKPIGYSVSKSGVYNLTRYLATYWADKHIRVNTLTLAGVYNKQEKEFLDNYCSIIPIGRMAHQDEYNGAILFLSSDASKYMTGANLIIDGGWTAL